MSFGEGNLRERVKGLQEANVALADYKDELKSENEKLCERVGKLESLVLNMLSAIELGSMSDFTDRRVLASWFRDYSAMASELGIGADDA